MGIVMYAFCFIASSYITSTYEAVLASGVLISGTLYIVTGGLLMYESRNDDDHS